MKVFDRTVDLFNAAEQSNLGEVKIFFSMGADVLARNGHTVLHSAVCSDNGEVVKLFLNKIAETQGSVIPYIDAKDTEGDTPLMWTAANCYINAAKLLLEYGADVEAKNNDRKTALHWAAKTNHVEVIKLLLGGGANINVNDKYGKKPLDYAKEEGHEEVVGYLAFSVTSSECEFRSVCSSSKRYQEVQKLEEYYLVSKRDDVETIKKGITEHIKDRFHDLFTVRGKDRGKSAWHYALIDRDKKEKFHEKKKSGSLDVTDYGKILCSGFGENPPQNIKDKVDECFKKKLSMLFVIKEKFENLIFYHYVLIEADKTNVKNYGNVIYSGCGQDPSEIIGEKIITSYFGINEKQLEEEFANLNVEESKTFLDAVRNGKLEALRSFVEESSVDINGWTPLHYAAYVGNKEAVEYLISIGVNLKVRDAVLGRMPVHIAAREGHNDTLELLLNTSLKIYDVDENGWTPLHYATWGGHFNLIKLLIEKGFDIHAKEATRGKKPIHIAAESGYMNIVKFLLESGVEIDDTDGEGRTSLYYATWKGHLDIVKDLAGRGADIHAKNIFGSVPIHIASSGGHVNIIEFLLDQGAKVYDLNNNKLTPLHFAAEDGQLGTVDFLLYRGANVNDSTVNKHTPLHFAAEGGQLEVVKFLLTKGAEIEVRNNDGKTPSDLARANGYTMVADILDG